MTQHNNIIRERGVSVYLALVIMFILLDIGLSLSTLLIGQIKVIREMGNSVAAFYAADTGIEREIYDRNPHDSGCAYHVFLDLDGDNNGTICGTACDTEDPCPLGPCPSSFDPGDACYQVTVIDRGGVDCDPLTVTTECIQSVGIYKGVRRAIKVSW